MEKSAQVGLAIGGTVTVGLVAYLLLKPTIAAAAANKKTSLASRNNLSNSGLTTRPSTTNIKPNPNSDAALISGGLSAVLQLIKKKPSKNTTADKLQKPPSKTNQSIQDSYTDANGNIVDSKTKKVIGYDNKDGLTWTDLEGNITDNITGDIVGYDNGDGLTWTDLNGNIYDDITGELTGYDNGDGSTWTDLEGNITDNITGDIVGYDNGDGSTWTDLNGNIYDDITGELTGYDNYNGSWTDLSGITYDDTTGEELPFTTVTQADLQAYESAYTGFDGSKSLGQGSYAIPLAIGAIGLFFVYSGIKK